MFLPFVLFFWAVLVCWAVWGFIDALVQASAQRGERDAGAATTSAGRRPAGEQRPRVPRRHGWRRPHRAG